MFNTLGNIIIIIKLHHIYFVIMFNKYIIIVILNYIHVFVEHTCTTLTSNIFNII